jgi:hypothetical protein
MILEFGKYACISSGRISLKNQSIAFGPYPNIIPIMLSEAAMSVCFMRINRDMRESHFSLSPERMNDIDPTKSVKKKTVNILFFT